MDRFDFFAPLGRARPSGVPFTSSYLTPLELNRYSVVAELGCGYGLRSAWLARSRCCKVFAFDEDQRSLDHTYHLAEESGAHELIELREGNLREPDLPPKSLDLIVSERGTFSLGIAEAIERWRPFIKPGGHLALCYPGLVDNRGAEESEQTELIEPLKQWVGGPLGGLSNYHELISESGLRLVHQAQLSPRLWDTFYKDFARHLRALRKNGAISVESPLYQELSADLEWYQGWARGRVFLQAFLLRIPE